MHRVSASLVGAVHPLFRALSGRLKFTVRRQKFNRDSLSLCTLYQLSAHSVPSFRAISEGLEMIRWHKFNKDSLSAAGAVRRSEARTRDGVASQVCPRGVLFRNTRTPRRSTPSSRDNHAMYPEPEIMNHGLQGVPRL